VASFEEGLALGDADCVMVLTRHDSHARYAARVLEEGLTLYCEKPLALDEEELETIAAAWLAGQAPVMVGFNRRFAPPVRELKALLDPRLPVQITYRVFAGGLPAGHWYFDERQGGRLLGEVCHFVDLAGYLSGSPPVRVHARTVGHRGDARQAQSVSLLIDYANGSTATVVYGGATPPGAPKELVEVAADGLAARVEDYRSLSVWRGGRPRVTRYRHAAKGHAEEMQALVALTAGAEPAGAGDFRLSLWSTLATLRAVDAARAAEAVPIEPRLPSLRTALDHASLEW
jgi:predicted dehydrogenase